jgi:hypothetical protein
MNEDQLSKLLDQDESEGISDLPVDSEPDPEVVPAQVPARPAEVVPLRVDLVVVQDKHRELLIELAKLEPRSIGAFKLYGMRKGMAGALVDATVEDLVRSKRLEPFKHFKHGRSFRVPRGLDAAELARRLDEASSIPDDEKERGASRQVTAPDLAIVDEVHTEEKKTMARTKEEWISTADAAAFLGCSPSNVLLMAKAGKIKWRKPGNGPRAPLQILRSSLAKHQSDFISTPAPELAEAKDTSRKPPKAAKPKKEKRAPARTLEEVAERHAPASSLGAQVRWVIEGVRIQRFTPEQALSEIADVLDAWET